MDICISAKQEEGYIAYGHYPRNRASELEVAFNTHMHKAFPNDNFTSSVTLQQREGEDSLTMDQEYIFGVHMDYTHHDSTSLYLAILEFVLAQFSPDCGIDLYVARTNQAK